VILVGVKKWGKGWCIPYSAFLVNSRPWDTAILDLEVRLESLHDIRSILPEAFDFIMPNPLDITGYDCAWGGSGEDSHGEATNVVECANHVGLKLETC
jgi:hypothetical protein